jgi:hypothetical protein
VTTKQDRRFRFTKRKITDLPKPEREVQYRDKEIHVLALKHYPSDKKTFIVNGACKGLGTISFKLGSFPALSLEEARREAMAAKLKMQKGIHPTLEQNNAFKESTFNEAFENWIENHCRLKNSPRTVSENISLYRLYVGPLIGKWRIGQITPKMVEDLNIRAYNKDGKYSTEDCRKENRRYAANRAVGLVRAVFNYQGDLGWDGSNPATRIKKFRLRGTCDFHSPTSQRT